MPPRAAKRARTRLIDLLNADRLGGLAVVIATAAALVWANAAPHNYVDLWQTARPAPGWLGGPTSLRTWIDQAVLVLFFAVIGLEIRRETVGELASWRRATVPVVAALAGMAAPALLYAAVVAGGTGARGWGVPMATDVAFALGALALIGGTSPRARVFLMTLAVADDIGSIIVLVAFYGRHTKPLWLLLGLAAILVLSGAWAIRSHVVVRGLLMVAAWWAMLRSGSDAAVVGAAAGFFGPVRRTRASGVPRVRVWVRRFQPAVNVVVLPLFALANVGVRVEPSRIDHGAPLRILIAVTVARVVGKPIGIAVGAVVSERLTGRVDAARLLGRRLFGVGALGAVGFTVPLLIVTVVFPPGPLADAATVALLVGSVLGVVVSALLLRLRGGAPPLGSRRPPRPGLRRGRRLPIGV